MKKLLIGLFCILFVFSLSGCGEKSPSDVVKEALDAAKEKDTKTVNSIYLGKDLDFGALVNESSTGTELSQESQALLAEKLLDFDYTIDKEEIKGDKATVTVSITTYDFASATRTFFSDALSQAFSLAFSGASEEEMTQATEESLNNALSELTEKTKIQTATLFLTKGDEGWAVDDFTKNTKFIDAITGGAYSVFTEMEDNFSDSEDIFEDETLTDDSITDFDFYDYENLDAESGYEYDNSESQRKYDEVMSIYDARNAERRALEKMGQEDQNNDYTPQYEQEENTNNDDNNETAEKIIEKAKQEMRQ